MLEKQLQRKIILFLKTEGYRAIKIESPTEKGFPDLFCFLDSANSIANKSKERHSNKSGKPLSAFLIEVKTKSGRLSEHQSQMIETLSLSIPVYVINDCNQLKEILC